MLNGQVKECRRPGVGKNCRLNSSVFTGGNLACPKLYSSEPWATYTQWIFNRHRFPLSMLLTERFALYFQLSTRAWEGSKR